MTTTDTLDALRNRKPKLVWVDVVLDSDIADELVVAESTVAKADIAAERAALAVETHDKLNPPVDVDYDAPVPDSDADPAAWAKARRALNTRRRLIEDAETAAAEAKKARAAVNRAKKAADPHTHRFTFQNIGRLALETMRTELPPTDKQREQFKAACIAAGKPELAQAGPEWDTDEYPPRLIHAALIEPRIDDYAEFRALVWDNPAWAESELIRLNMAAEAAQQSVSTVRNK